MDDKLRIIISGGGTGGHIFPAVSIANAIKELYPEAEILFVGALGRMEMQRVPAAGYKIIGLPICGFDRKNLLNNIKVLFKIWKSQRIAKNIIKEFKPMAAVGVGGYASGPLLNQAAKMGIPCLIQEQNSYAGVTNKLLAKKAERICVAYDGMEKFFPAEKIIKTFDEEPELQVLNGRFGPYIAYKGSNYKLPKSVTPAELTLEECMEIVNKQQEGGKAPAKRRYTKKSK